MASIKDTAATSALNEDKYINELYDTNLNNQNKLLEEAYGNNQGILDQEQQGLKDTTDAYVDRTAVEAGKAKDLYGDGGLSAGAQAQVGLSQENAQRRNVQQLREAQNDADLEFQRQRQLLASQYETAIKQAQADNDMERAQALYDAAKAEEAQLLELQKQGAQLLRDKRGDMTGYKALENGEFIARDTTGETWDEVRKNENAVNAIYDAQLESLMAELQSAYETSASELEAQRTAREKAADEKLTQSYTEALKGQKNAAEMAGAYGQGSGAAAQGRLASDIELQDILTDIRKAQVGAEGAAGVEAMELGKGYGQGRQSAQYDTDLQRAKALYEAAEGEEQTLVDLQKTVGEVYGKKGDYTMLGKLYGLTDEQIKKLKPSGGITKSKSGSKPSSDDSSKPEHERTDAGIIVPRDYVGIVRGYK